MIKKLSLNNSLDFPHSLEKIFLKQRTEEALSKIRLALVVGAVYTVLLGCIDFFVINQVAVDVWSIRVSLLAVLLATIALFHSSVVTVFYDFIVFSFSCHSFVSM